MRIAVLTVPYDAGRLRTGVGLGPSRLLEAGLTNTLREFGHEVREDAVDLPEPTPPHEMARIVAAQRELARLVTQAVTDGELPIVLAGNCSSAVGTLAAAPPDVAVVWFDAHADFNTAETTTTGMLDGLALSMVTGRALRGLTSTVSGFVPVREDRVVLVGARDLDPPEEDALGRSPVRRVAAGEAESRMTGALRELGDPAPPVYVHLDLDVLDPASARANQYAAPDGLSPSALCHALTAIAGTAPLYAFAITAYDPSWDDDGWTRRAAIEALGALVLSRPRR
jgi:arginase